MSDPVPDQPRPRTAASVRGRWRAARRALRRRPVRTLTWPARRLARLPGVRAVVRRGAALSALARHTWRRSLHFRMVTITLVASGLLVGGFGYLVAQRSVDFLID